ncbi:hypothetical protein ACH5RR_015654 [Cinchona calisaya]|uniref:Uncharacterized protein n=1 Tax=Cinchona calisaya TaxID=153742 RepID=A0ABD2ZWW4_9GENT
MHSWGDVDVAAEDDDGKLLDEMEVQEDLVVELLLLLLTVKLGDLEIVAEDLLKLLPSATSFSLVQFLSNVEFPVVRAKEKPNPKA